MTRFMACACALIMAGAAGGCATVTRGTTTKFLVDSAPEGAAIRTTNGYTCPATPCTFKMQRKGSFDIGVTKAGYKPYSTHVESKVAGGGAAGFLGNAVVGGVIGAGVDIASGAMNNLYPNPLHVTLLPDDAVPPPAPPPAATPAAAAATPASAPAPAAS